MKVLAATFLKLARGLRQHRTFFNAQSAKKYLRHLAQFYKKAVAMLPHRLPNRVRHSIVIGTMTILLVGSVVVIEHLLTPPSYTLGSASSLLSPVSQSHAQRIKHDQNEKLFTFNEGFVAAPTGKLLDRASPLLLMKTQKMA